MPSEPGNRLADNHALEMEAWQNDAAIQLAAALAGSEDIVSLRQPQPDGIDGDYTPKHLTEELLTDVEILKLPAAQAVIGAISNAETYRWRTARARRMGEDDV